MDKMIVGMPCETARFMLQILENIKHYISMEGFVSEKFVESGLLAHFDETGKETGWAPAIWQVVFDIVLAAVDRFQPGFPDLPRPRDDRVQDG